jgi:hypothetical protein
MTRQLCIAVAANVCHFGLVTGVDITLNNSGSTQMSQQEQQQLQDSVQQIVEHQHQEQQQMMQQQQKPKRRRNNNRQSQQQQQMKQLDPSNMMGELKPAIIINDLQPAAQAQLRQSIAAGQHQQPLVGFRGKEGGRQVVFSVEANPLICPLFQYSNSIIHSSSKCTYNNNRCNCNSPVRRRNISNSYSSKTDSSYSRPPVDIFNYKMVIVVNNNLNV